MSSFALAKCPFCLKENVTGTITGFNFTDKESNCYRNQFLFHIFGHCNHCLMGMIGNGLISNDYNHRRDIQHYQGDIESFKPIVGLKLDWYPKPPKLDIPENLPKNVEKKFAQAEKLFNLNDMLDPSGNAYRSTLERSIVHIDTTLTKGNLFSRIETLAKNGLITEALKDFAHQIRVLGNDATHNDDDITKEELENLRIFTRMFLMYVFTLPAMLPKKSII